MMGKFTHYLITRFNIVEKTRVWDKNQQPILDADWLYHRLDLFTRFCVPTVSGQSEKSFKWLIYLDAASDAGLINTIKQLTAELSNTILCYAEDMTGFLKDVDQRLRNSPTSFVISSRVDNDDGLGRDYISTIQKYFKEQDGLLINLLGGVCYDIDQKVLTQLKKSELNHYGSLIELTNPLKGHLTIFGFRHTSPLSHLTILNVLTEGSWLKIIHTRNARSQLKGKLVLTKKILKHFTISSESISISLPNSIFYIFSRIKKRI